MNRPYIVCHMMMSIDGRIDCAMTENLPGDEYYKTLNSLDTSASLMGRVTAEKEMASGYFKSVDSSINKEVFYKARNAKGYEIIVDTKGVLLWDNYKNNDEEALLIITSEEVKKDYLDYLKVKKISYISVGKEKINLKRAMEILYEEFGVKRMALLGGGTINGGFLKEGLIDEISILIGAGIDGKKGMSSVFDGLPMDSNVYQLKLLSVESYKSGAVWIRYKTE